MTSASNLYDEAWVRDDETDAVGPAPACSSASASAFAVVTYNIFARSLASSCTPWSMSVDRPGITAVCAPDALSRWIESVATPAYKCMCCILSLSLSHTHTHTEPFFGTESQ
jgi:hypothetical protein